ncbi:MAG: exopolysaccharide biosynthesis polyprenyl glycosylphosphotransferase [bacterium]
MTILNKNEPFTLFLGDIIAFVVALWVTLFIRLGSVPTNTLLESYVAPFVILFVAWVLVFFIAGLYEKHTTILRNRLPGIILNAQIANTVIAFIFFYFVPVFGIAPKTTLIIYLFVSFGSILLWRLYGINFLVPQRRNMALLVGSGSEMKELYEEVNSNNRYNFKFISSIDLDNISQSDFQEEIVNRIYTEDISTIVIDLHHKKVEPVLSHLYDLIFFRVSFIDIHKVYEDIFDRVPISLLKDGWFIENISLSPKVTYDFLKRSMDILFSVVFGFASLIVYPFVVLAIKIQDGGPVFISQERAGKNNKVIKIYKFRSMKGSDSGKWITKDDNRHTIVGKFIRKTRIDELPQLWNVLVGDISLIGPRPDLVVFNEQLSKEIPYYNVRSTIKPGLSGWAQTHQEKPPQSVEETKIRLSYDLYYVKNRSFIIDVKIALRTLYILISRQGL